GDDRSGDRPELHARRLSVDGRAGRPGRLGGARAREALRRLDLARLPGDGAGRLRVGGGQAVSAAAGGAGGGGCARFGVCMTSLLRVERRTGGAGEALRLAARTASAPAARGLPGSASEIR